MRNWSFMANALIFTEMTDVYRDNLYSVYIVGIVLLCAKVTAGGLVISHQPFPLFHVLKEKPL